MHQSPRFITVVYRVSDASFLTGEGMELADSGRASKLGQKERAYFGAVVALNEADASKQPYNAASKFAAAASKCETGKDLQNAFRAMHCTSTFKGFS